MTPMDVFSRAVPANERLDPAFIKAHGYHALVVPEQPSNDEIFAVAELVGETDFQAFAHEWRKVPLVRESQAITDIVGFLNEETALNRLVRFIGCEMFFWMPEDHEFFVIFGKPSRIETIRRSGVFSYTFEDYLAEGYFSETVKRHLRQVGATYGFRSAPTTDIPERK